MDQNTQADKGQNPIIETAERLSEKFNHPVTVAYGHRGPLAKPLYRITSGHAGSDESRPGGWLTRDGISLAEAEAKFLSAREQCDRRDPLEGLRKRAAAEGYDLVPLSAPLDLKTSTSAQG